MEHIDVWPAADVIPPETLELVFKCTKCGQTGHTLVSPSEVSWHDD